MVGGKLKINSRIGASSILEVIIAMVLILIVFTIAMMISANVLRSSLSFKKINAHAILHETLIEVELGADIGSKSFTIDDFEVVQEVKPYNGTPGLKEVHLKAYDSNKQLIAEAKKIAITQNE